MATEKYHNKNLQVKTVTRLSIYWRGSSKQFTFGDTAMTSCLLFLMPSMH